MEKIDDIIRWGGVVEGLEGRVRARVCPAREMTVETEINEKLADEKFVESSNVVGRGEDDRFFRSSN